MKLDLKTIFGGLAIASIIILSSVPFVELGGNTEISSISEFCTQTHHKDEAACKADRDHGCVWCIARAVPSMCYDLDVAKQLPHSVFKCDFPGAEPTLTDFETE